MEIIVTHISSDFDSFSGMVAAKKIYPDAHIILPTAINENVRRFISFYEDELPLLEDQADVDFNDVKRIIVIDTRIASRLGKAEVSLKNRDVEIIVFDHHPRSQYDLKPTLEYSMQVGATTTILAGIIKRKKIDISPLEATLFALGIYEDTGSFTYPGTSYRDLEAASYLFRKGADITTISRFLNLALTQTQHGLLEKLIMNSRKIKINEKSILISWAKVQNYVEGLSVLARKLSQIEDISVVFCWVKMKDKIYVVSRSDDKDVDVSRILDCIGGGGHPQAASAIVRDLEFEEIERRIIQSLTKNIKKPVLARDIMSYPVKVINENESILRADGILKKYGHSGIPIVDSDSNLAGIITRKDIDKAMSHGLSHAPVKGFKSHGVISASPNTSVEEIQEMMMENNVGRIPVVSRGEIVGIITRKDVLRFLHDRNYSENKSWLAMKDDIFKENYFSVDVKERILTLFPAEIQGILKKAALLGKRLGYNVYLVGGVVRDILLNVPNLDVDIVVEGDGIKFANELSKECKCKIESHYKFGTAVLILESGQHVDIATARKEYYEKPAALPCVEVSSIKEDLSRRDFTINAMAVSLNEYDFGEILDFFGGRKDLRDKKVKVLHKMSFVEDPTRIFRAVRFEQRLGFKMDELTEKLARSAIEMDIVCKLTGVRIRDELISIFGEEKPWKAIKRLYELGALRKIGLDVEVNQRFVESIKKTLRFYDKFYYFYRDKVEKWRLIFILLIKESSLVGDGSLSCGGNSSLRGVEKWCSTMKVKKKDTRVILTSLEKWEQARENLKLVVSPNSLLYEIVSEIPYELQIIACGWGKNYLKNIERFIGISGIELSITGDTLIQMGYKPSESFKHVLDELFKMKLDGKIDGENEEIAYARKLMEQ
ncbi:MAG: CBS domain-containing protein [Actinobacteria bacterium]|nr:CBS domain-containing protein [Actinomycetota bacterium]